MCVFIVVQPVEDETHFRPAMFTYVLLGVSCVLLLLANLALWIVRFGCTDTVETTNTANNLHDNKLYKKQLTTEHFITKDSKPKNRIVNNRDKLFSQQQHHNKQNHKQCTKSSIIITTTRSVVILTFHPPQVVNREYVHHCVQEPGPLSAADDCGVPRGNQQN